MPIAKIQTPDGRTMTLEVPEGATQEQIISFAQQNYKPSEPQTPQAEPMQKPVDETPKIPVGALPMGLQDVMLQSGQAVEDDTAINEAMQSIAKQSPEIAGGISGGLMGEKFGRPFGSGGRVLGGIAGGILGSTAGKEAQQGLGLQQEQTTGSNVGEAAKEEAVARAITSGLGIGGKLLAPIVKPITKEARAFAESLGIVKPQEGKNIEDLFISSSTFNPQAKDARNIIDAQDNILNERMLTVFEETGGRADVKRAMDMQEAVAQSRRVSDVESTFLANRDKINQRLEKALTADIGTDRLQNVQARGIRDSYNQYFKGFNKKFENIKRELIPLRSKVVYKIPKDTMSKVLAKRARIEDSVTQEEARKLITAVESVLMESRPASKILGVDGKPIRESSTALKERITDKSLKDLDNKIKSMLPKFSDSKDVQSKIAGVYSAEIKPILHEIKTSNINSNPTDNMLKLAKLDGEFTKLAETKGALVNSKVGKALGLTEERQIAKAIKPERLANVIFESPETWQQTKAVLQDVNPKLIPIISNNYKAKIATDLFKEGEISPSRINTLIKTQSDVIKDIGGEDYLTALKDAEMISGALRASKGIAKAPLKMTPEDTIVGSAAGVLFNQLAPKKRLFAGVFAKGKRAFGMGGVSDADLLQAMTGKEGERTLGNMTRTFLDDPQAYNNYVQFVREVQKVNDSAEPIDEKTFNQRVGSILDSVLDSEQSMQKQEEIKQKASELINTIDEKTKPNSSLQQRLQEALQKRGSNE